MQLRRTEHPAPTSPVLPDGAVSASNLESEITASPPRDMENAPPDDDAELRRNSERTMSGAAPMTAIAPPLMAVLSRNSHLSSSAVMPSPEK